LFAGDSKVWRQKKSPDDQIEFQIDLHTLQEGSVNLLLKLNVEKCKQLNVGPSTESQYYIGEDTNKKNLQRVVEERDLGVIFTSILKWATQCQKTAA